MFVQSGIEGFDAVHPIDFDGLDSREMVWVGGGAVRIEGAVKLSQLELLLLAAYLKCKLTPS